MRKGTSLYLYIVCEISFSWGMHLPKPLTDLSGKSAKGQRSSRYFSLVKYWVWVNIFLCHVCILFHEWVVHNMRMKKYSNPNNLGKTAFHIIYPCLKKTNSIAKIVLWQLPWVHMGLAGTGNPTHLHPSLCETHGHEHAGLGLVGLVAPCLVRI